MHSNQSGLQKQLLAAQSHAIMTVSLNARLNLPHSHRRRSMTCHCSMITMTCPKHHDSKGWLDS